MHDEPGHAEPAQQQPAGQDGPERDRDTGAPRAAEPGGQRKGGGGFWLSLLVVAAAVAGAWWWQTGGAGTGPAASTVAAAPAAPPPPPAVTVSRPLVTEVTESNEYTAQFSAVEYVEVRARVSGFLTEIHFKDGEVVNQGDLLFVIDARPFENDARQAEANLARDHAQLNRANLDLHRYIELAQKNYAPQRQLDQARASAEAAAATVKADEAALAQARLNLEFTRVTAPIGGRASSHNVSIGNLVTGGASNTTTLLTTIVSLDPIYLTFDVSEADQLAYRRAIAAGTLRSARDSVVTVQARLVDEHNWSREGRIDFVDNQLNRGAGTLRLRAVFANPDQLLTPGQFARVRVPVSAPHAAILVPDRALVSDQARKVVMVVAADGTVMPRPVQPGPTWRGLRILRSGLGPDDPVIIDGLMRARPGTRVTPQPGRIEPEPQAD